MSRIQIKTRIPELYHKLGYLNLMDDIVLSNQIPEKVLKNMINNINRNGDLLSLTVLPDKKYILSKRGNISFDVYKRF